MVRLIRLDISLDLEMELSNRRIHVFLLLLLIAASVFISGCGASVSPNRWRDDASARFNTAIAAGAENFAPEETDNIRRTITLADRYFGSAMLDDADRLYQLSSQKTQLLYRNLVADKIRTGAAIVVEDAGTEKESEQVVADAVLSLKQLVHDNDEEEYDDFPEIAGNTLPSMLMLSEQSNSLHNEQGISLPKDSVRIPAARQSHAATVISSAKSEARKSLANVPKAGGKNSGNNLPAQPSKAVTLYLTFDDGPSRLTLPIAAYLSSQGIKATFFALGNNIKGREKTLSTVIGMGHRVGSHTMSHNLRKLNESFNEASNEVRKTADMIDHLGGDGRLVRIPYGSSTKKLVSNIAAEGAQIVEWDIDSNDTTRAGVKNHLVIERAVFKHLRNSKKRHLVLLFHDGSGHDATLTAIKSLVPRLKQEGYAFGVLARHETVAASGVAQKRYQP